MIKQKVEERLNISIQPSWRIILKGTYSARGRVNHIYRGNISAPPDRPGVESKEQVVKYETHTQDSAKWPSETQTNIDSSL